MSVRTPDHWPEHGVPLYFFKDNVRPIRKNTSFLKPRIAAIRTEWKLMNLETLYPRVREMTDWLYPNDRRRSTHVFATFIAAETIRRDGRQPNQSWRHDPSYRAGSSHPSTPKRQAKANGQLPTPEPTPGPTQNPNVPGSPSRDSPLARRPYTRAFTSNLRTARNTMSPAMAAKIAQFETDTRITLRELRRELLEEEDYTEAEADDLLQGVVDGLVDQSDADEVIEG